MVVCPSGDDIKAKLLELVAHGGGVQHDLVDVLLIRRLQSLGGSNCFCRDDVLQRAALNSGENCAVDLLRKLRLAEDKAAARPAKRLMRGSSNHIREPEGGRMLFCGHEAGNVCHVHHQVCAHFIRDFTELFEVNDTTVGARSGKNDFRMIGQRLLLDVLHVNETVLVDPIENHIVHHAAEVARSPMREVASVVQLHGEDDRGVVANRLAAEQGQISCHVRV